MLINQKEISMLYDEYVVGSKVAESFLLHKAREQAIRARGQQIIERANMIRENVIR